MRVLAIHHEDWKSYWLRAASRRKHRNLGSLDVVIRESGFGCDYYEVATGQALRRDIRRYSHIVVLGGNMGAYEEDVHRFLIEEMRLLERALAWGIPVLGICLGAQLLARIHGARVYPGPRGPELNWNIISLTEEGRREPLLAGFRAETSVFQWHKDSFDLPAAATRLASSARYENQAFHVGQLAWGLQFHLEADPTLIRSWLRSYGDGMPARSEDVGRDTDRFIADHMAAAGVFLRGFLAVGREDFTAGSPQVGGSPG